MTEIDGAVVFEGMNKSFRRIILSKEVRPYVVRALNAINGDDISPKQEDIFAFARWPADDVKVVIIGQDPYPNFAHAHGYAFSSLENKIPASLQNIYKALIGAKLIDNMPKTANLISWVRQGVLLINTALTTKVGIAGAHIKHWNPITSAIIGHFGSLDRPICFMLWGNHAKKMRPLIRNGLVLEWGHPSPLARDSRFHECDHFTKANEFLVANDMRPIDWVVDRHIELNVSASDNNGSKYTNEVSFVCKVIADGELIATLDGNVRTDADFENNKIIFPTLMRGIECAEKMGREYCDSIGYSTLNITVV